MAPYGSARSPKFPPACAPQGDTKVPMAAPGVTTTDMDGKEARVEEDEAPTVDPSLHAAALGSRPGVLRVGFFSQGGWQRVDANIYSQALLRVARRTLGVL